jgi:hypothetical protein
MLTVDSAHLTKCNRILVNRLLQFSCYLITEWWARCLSEVTGTGTLSLPSLKSKQGVS